jgi:hypothetical protein
MVLILSLHLGFPGHANPLALYPVTFLANCHSAHGRSSCRRDAENETMNTDGKTQTAAA